MVDGKLLQQWLDALPEGPQPYTELPPLSYLPAVLPLTSELTGVNGDLGSNLNSWALTIEWEAVLISTWRLIKDAYLRTLTTEQRQLAANIKVRQGFVNKRPKKTAYQRRQEGRKLQKDLWQELKELLQEFQENGE